MFRTFCAHLNEAAKGFATGPGRDFAKHFSSSFLDFWKQTLTNTNYASAPTYNSIAANATTSPTRSAPSTTVRPQHKPDISHRQGQPPVHAPPREDLRIFASKPTPRPNHIGYAIRAHVASKTELNSAKFRKSFQ